MSIARRALRSLAPLTLSACLVALVATASSGTGARTPSRDAPRSVVGTAPDHLAVVSTAGAVEPDLGAALRRLPSPIARLVDLYAALALASLAWLAARMPSAVVSGVPGAIPRRRAPPLTP